MIPVEAHPLSPFLPFGANILMLGTFPPKKNRWSIDFFYPNFQNDMWRVWGLVFFDNPNEFVIQEEKRFDYEKIVSFCNQYGIAVFDTAKLVQRLQDNASDKFLKIIETTELQELLIKIPRCKAIVTTGEKATDVIVEKYKCEKPSVGKSVSVTIADKTYDFVRMPSSSRAYPLSLAKKVEEYNLLKRYFQ